MSILVVFVFVGKIKKKIEEKKNICLFLKGEAFVIICVLLKLPTEMVFFSFKEKKFDNNKIQLSRAVFT